MIRQVIKEDLVKINEYSKLFNYSITEYDLTNHPFSKYLVVLDENDIVGFLDYGIYYDRAEINYIYIEENYRRKGHATSLIKCLVDECISNKYLNITLEVNENNSKAIDLYKKNGFELVARRNNYYKNDSALLMIRKFGE